MSEPSQLVLVPSNNRHRFFLKRFMELLRIVHLAVREGWPLTILASGAQSSYIVVASEPYAKKIREELGL